jgi:opacity protein-like surface antigen
MAVPASNSNTALYKTKNPVPGVDQEPGIAGFALCAEPATVHHCTEPEEMMGRRRGLTVLFIGLIAITVGVSPCAAGGIGAGNGEIGFDLGILILDSDKGDDTGGLVAIRGGYFFSNLFEIEGEVKYSYTPELGGGDTDLVLGGVFLNAVFNFGSSEKVVPYLRAGVGYAYAEVWNHYDDDDNGTASQFGFGARFFVGNTMAIRVEATYILEDTFDDDGGHISVVAGLTWRLGAGK